jgi:sugar-specific transcriptional regulator TrmB
MVFDKDVTISDLELLGLTKTEAEVYVALVSTGVSTATQIIEAVGLHQPQFYDVITSLHRKGFVEIQDGRPKLYRVVEPELIIGRITSEIGKRKKRLLKALSEIYQKSVVVGTPTIWITKGKKNIIRNAIQVINRAQIDLVVCVNQELLKPLLRYLRSARKRGVQVFLLIHPKKPIPSDLIRKLDGMGQVRSIAAGDFAVIADSLTCFFVQHTVLSRKMGLDCYGIMIDEPTLSDIVMHDLAFKWMRGAPIFQEKIDLTHYPKKLTLHRLSLIEMEKLRREGYNVKAKVVGRYVKTGKKFEAEGQITDIIVDMDALIFNFSIKTREGEILTVGGPDAALEDVAANHVLIEPVLSKSGDQ